MSEKYSPRCIIFDCDGVLVDSEPIGIRALLDMAAAHGFIMSYEKAVAVFKGWSLRAQFDYIQKITGKPLPDNFEEAYREYSFTLLRETITPIPGAASFIERLKIPYCVASNGPPEKMKITLSKCGLADYFTDNIYSGYQIGKFKPDPALFEYAARDMGFIASDCLVIDDSDAGVQAAMQGNFPVLHFNPDGQTEILKHHVPVVTGYHDIIGLLNGKVFKTG